MAQSKLEIEAVTANKPHKAKRAEKNTVPDLLLQQHQASLLRGITVRISNRFLYWSVITSLVLVNRLTVWHLIATITVATFSAILWSSEKRWIQVKKMAFQKTLAERSGEEWEDIYIKSRYHTSAQAKKRRALDAEPIIWAILVALLGIIRFYLERKSLL